MKKDWIQYRISTWQSNWGERKWHFVITKYVRTQFKRSKRVGWRRMGFVTVSQSKHYDSRSEALKAAQDARKQLLGTYEVPAHQRCNLEDM